MNTSEKSSWANGVDFSRNLTSPGKIQIPLSEVFVTVRGVTVPLAEVTITIGAPVDVALERPATATPIA